VRHRPYRVPALRSSFAGFRFPPEVIMLAIRWYLRYGNIRRGHYELGTEETVTYGSRLP
jgi:transposase, IS6 family